MSATHTAAPLSRPATEQASALRLSGRQMVRLVVLGVVLWFVFARLIHG